MHIVINVEEKVKEYNVGDIITWGAKRFTIIKNPANGLYSLMSSECDYFANGMFNTVEELMDDWIDYTKGVIKHYPESEYELHLVKKSTK